MRLLRHKKTELSRYQAVNKCETLKQLADVIRSFADKDGMIQGRTQKFNAETMARACESKVYATAAPNLLTRQWGIRQQALYILHYS